MQKSHTIKGIYERCSRLIRPQLRIGGLELSNEGIVFFREAEKNNPENSIKASLRLDSGVIEDGKLLQPEKFRRSIQTLRKMITKKKNETIPIILSISDQNVYTQRFSLPPLKRSEVRQAIQLNMQAISPVDMGTTYYDSEYMKEMSESGEQEILASFVHKDIVDGFLKILQEEGFFVAAIEQKATSLARGFIGFEKKFDPQKSYLLVATTGDGIGFIIVRKESLYFSRFTPWKLVIEHGSLEQQHQEEFRNFLVREYHQIHNFFSNKFHDEFSCIFVISSTATEFILDVFKKNLSVPIASIQINALGINESWFVALGASVRGEVPRSQDRQISLAPEGTELLYQQMRIHSFLSLWTRVFSSVSFVILAAFLGVFIFLNQYIKANIDAVLSSFNDPQVLAQYEFYRKESEIFNKKVEMAVELRKQHIQWGKFVADIFKQVPTQVVIDRMYVQSREMPITINARTTSEFEAQEFKNRIQKLPYITGVDLPLSSFQKADETYTSFRLSFRLKNVDF